MPSRPKGQPRPQVEPRTIGPAAPYGTKAGYNTRNGPAPVNVPEAPPPPAGNRVAPRKIGPMAPRRPRRSEENVPKQEEHALRTEAREKFPNDTDRQDAYVYGTMRKQGWKPEHHSPWDGKTYRHWWYGKCRV